MEQNLQQRIDCVKARAPHGQLEVWCQDEARLGLTPIVRRVWALRGQRPVAHTHTRYAWLYVYGFVRPATGQTDWVMLPLVHTAAMTVALAEFARDVGAGSTKQVVLVLDHAGWHTSKHLVLPPGLEVVSVPAATPELQPAERLWPLVREAIANRTFAHLDSVQDKLVERCLQLRDQAPMIQRVTNDHWLPTI